MIAAGDENLVALEPVGAIGCGFGASTDVRQRRACMGLGQCHGAEETPVDHRLQEALLLLIGAETFDQVRRAHGQERVGGRRCVGRLKMRETSLRKQSWQLHATGLETARGVEEAGFEEGIDRRFYLWNQYRLAVFVARFVLVALAVVRSKELLGNASCRADGGIEGLTIVL